MNRARCWLILVAGVAAAPFVSCRKTPEAGTTAGTAVAEGTAETSPVFEIEGTYRGGGTTPDGRTYDCDVKLIRMKQVYGVERRVGDRPIVPGLGILRGNLFVVGYRDERERYAVIAYEVEPDGTFEGTSAHQDGTKTGAETLKRK